MIQQAVSVEILAQGVGDLAVRRPDHEHARELDVLVREEDPLERIDLVGCIDLEIAVVVTHLPAAVREIGRVVERLGIGVDHVRERVGRARQTHTARHRVERQHQVHRPVRHQQVVRRRWIDEQREGDAGPLAARNPSDVLG